MEINLGKPKVGERSAVINRGSVIIGPLKREKEMLNASGDIIESILHK